MAEKIKVTREMLEQDPPEVIVDASIPYSTLERIGLFIATETTVLDDSGCAYFSWRRPLVECFAYLSFASNLNVSELDDWDDRMALYDVYGKKVNDLMDGRYSEAELVSDIVYEAQSAIKTMHERRNSLDYKLGLLADAIRAQSDKDATEMSEKLIDLMEKVKEADAKAPVADLRLFAKKETGQK